MKRALIVGVMGGAQAAPSIENAAYHLGALIARNEWILLNGGRNTGVMAASAKGAAQHGGITVGILPDAACESASPHIVIPICTGMGSGRNIINVLSSDVIVACPGGAGTISEIALALKHGKPVFTMGFDIDPVFIKYKTCGLLTVVDSPEQAIELIKQRMHSF